MASPAQAGTTFRYRAAQAAQGCFRAAVGDDDKVCGLSAQLEGPRETLHRLSLLFPRLSTYWSRGRGYRGLVPTVGRQRNLFPLGTGGLGAAAGGQGCWQGPLGKTESAGLGYGNGGRLRESLRGRYRKKDEQEPGGGICSGLFLLVSSSTFFPWFVV